MRKLFLDYFLKYTILIISILTLILLFLQKELNYWVLYLAVSLIISSYFLVKQKWLKISVIVLSAIFISIVVFFIQTARPILFEYSFLYSIHLQFSLILLLTLIFLIIQYLFEKVNEKIFYNSFLFFVLAILIFSAKPYKRLADKRYYILHKLEMVDNGLIDISKERMKGFSNCLYDNFSEIYKYSNNFPDSTNYSFKDNEIIFECSFNYLLENSEDYNYEEQKKAFMNNF